MRCQVTYWTGSETVTLDGTGDAWRHLPAFGVLFVDVWSAGYHQRLGGMDNYWVDGDSFGMLNDPENFDWYEGAQQIAWRWTGAGSEIVLDSAPPAHARVLRGVMVPDDVWEAARRLPWL